MAEEKEKCEKLEAKLKEYESQLHQLQKEKEEEQNEQKVVEICERNHLVSKQILVLFLLNFYFSADIFCNRPFRKIGLPRQQQIVSLFRSQDEASFSGMLSTATAEVERLKREKSRLTQEVAVMKRQRMRARRQLVEREEELKLKIASLETALRASRKIKKVKKQNLPTFSQFVFPHIELFLPKGETTI